MGSSLFEPGQQALPGPQLLESTQQKYGAEQMQSLLASLQAGQAPTLDIEGLSALEQQSLSLLGSFIGQGLPSAYTTALGELEKTVAGGYDPAKSPLYQSMVAESERLTEGGLAQIATQAELGGMLGSTGRMAAQGEYLGATQNELMRQLGLMTEAERGRQFGAVPLLLQAGQGQQAMQLGQIGAGMQYGQLPRQIEQARSEAAFQQQMMPYTQGAQIAGQLMQYAPFYQPQFAQTPSGFEKIAGVVGVGADLASIYKDIQPTPPPPSPSDIRLKDNIVKTGEIDGINVYEFNFIGNPQRYQGVIAQEVRHIPGVVVTGNDGFLRVNYSKLPVEYKEV